MDDLRIRPFGGTDAEYRAIAAIERACIEDSDSDPEAWKHSDRIRGRHLLQRRYVGELDDGIVASGFLCQPEWSFEPGKYFLHGSVLPEYHGQGFLARMCRHIMDEVAPLEPRLLTTTARIEEKERLAFLDAHGFEEVMRFPVSHLELSTFDVEPFADQLAAVRRADLRVVSLATWIEEMEARAPGSAGGSGAVPWQRRMYDLCWTLATDVPQPSPSTPMPFDQWVASELEGPGFVTDAWFIALDGDAWVGVTHLVARPFLDQWPVGLTGVLRSHRRRGLATALKVASVEYARDVGLRRLVTYNEEDNPILGLNRRLGFHHRSTVIYLEKPLRQGCAEVVVEEPAAVGAVMVENV